MAGKCTNSPFDEIDTREKEKVLPEFNPAEKNDVYKSVTTVDFEPVVQVKHCTKGRRLELLEKFYRDLINERMNVNDELNPIFDQLKVEDYDTEYRVEFSEEDLPAGCRSTGETDEFAELSKKFPLYSSYPMSYWEHEGTGRQDLNDRHHKFKRVTYYGRARNEVYEVELP